MFSSARAFLAKCGGRHHLDPFPLTGVEIMVGMNRHSNRHTPRRKCKMRSKFWWLTDFAIRMTYRISLRSSSMWEPRHPLLKVFYIYQDRSTKHRSTLSPRYCYHSSYLERLRATNGFDLGPKTINWLIVRGTQNEDEMFNHFVDLLCLLPIK